jgi:molybdenum cofactor cytidylyltransferase
VRAALPDKPSLRVVEVEDWAEGMGASLRAGIAALPVDCAGAFIFLGDMPRIPVSILVPLAEAVGAGALAAAPMLDGRQGHPVLLSAALFPDLSSLSGDRGARSLLERLGDRLAYIQAADDGVLFDVDLREDLV